MTTSAGTGAAARRSMSAGRGPSARGVAAVLLAAALGVLGACSDESGAPTSTSERPTATLAPTSSTPESTTTAAPSSTTTSPGDVDPEDFEDGAGTASFSTPDGDIGCVLVLAEHSARCDVADAEFDPPPTPADCQLDYGHALTLEGEGSGSFLCAGDTVLGSDHVLEDGQTLRYGDVSCRHAAWDGQEGVACSHATSGHGFRVSVAEYLLF